MRPKKNGLLLRRDVHGGKKNGWPLYKKQGFFSLEPFRLLGIYEEKME